MSEKGGRELKGEDGVGSLRATAVPRPNKRALHTATLASPKYAVRLSKELTVIKKAIDGRKR